MLHLKKQGKEEQTKFKISRRKRIIKIRAEINESKPKTEIQNIIKLQINGEAMAAAKYFISRAPKSLQTETTALKLSNVCSLREKL